MLNRLNSVLPYVFQIPVTIEHKYPQACNLTYCHNTYQRLVYQEINIFVQLEIGQGYSIWISLRTGRWCDIMVINAHAATEDKDDLVTDSFMRNWNRYHMKILLGDLNAKVGHEDIFKPTIGKESIHKISNDNGVRLVNFATSKDFIVKTTTFPHRNIGLHKQTWTSPDGQAHNQIDHILIDKQRESSILNIRSFRGADCDSDHYLLIAKLREGLSVAKRVDQIVDIDRFDVRKLKDEDIKLQYHVHISNRFDALRTSNEDAGEVHINDSWENIRDNIKVAAGESIGYYQVKKKKP